MQSNFHETTFVASYFHLIMLLVLGKMAGHPMPQIRWLKNEQEWTPDGSRIKPFVNDDGTFGLIFESTVGDDKGTYTAIAYRYSTKFMVS